MTNYRPADNLNELFSTFEKSPNAAEWEMDPQEICFEDKIGEGTFCNVFKGTYRFQPVAIKVVNNTHTYIR